MGSSLRILIFALIKYLFSKSQRVFYTAVLGVTSDKTCYKIWASKVILRATPCYDLAIILSNNTRAKGKTGLRAITWIYTNIQLG